MDAGWIALAAMAMGVTYDWRPIEGADNAPGRAGAPDQPAVEYTVTIEPELLDALRRGETRVLESSVPADAGSVRRVRVVLGEAVGVKHRAGRPVDDPPPLESRRHTVRQPITGGQLESGFQQATQQLEAADQLGRGVTQFGQSVQQGADQSRQAVNSLQNQFAQGQFPPLGSGEPRRPLLDGAGRLLDRAGNLVRGAGDAAREVRDGVRNALPGRRGGDQPTTGAPPLTSGGGYQPYSYRGAPAAAAPGGPNFPTGAPPATGAPAAGNFATGNFATDGGLNQPGVGAPAATGGFERSVVIDPRNATSPQRSPSAGLVPVTRPRRQEQPPVANDPSGFPRQDGGDRFRQDPFSRPLTPANGDDRYRGVAGADPAAGDPRGDFGPGRFADGFGGTGSPAGPGNQPFRDPSAAAPPAVVTVFDNTAPSDRGTYQPPFGAPGEGLGQPATGDRFEAPPFLSDGGDRPPTPQAVDQFGRVQPPAPSQFDRPLIGQPDGRAQPGLAQPGAPSQAGFGQFGVTPTTGYQGGPSQQLPPPQLPTEPVDRPWDKLVLATLAAVGSIGGNVFLGWSYLDARNKYRSALRRTSRTFGRSASPDAA